MGKVELNISSDIRELLVGTEKLNSNVKELNKTTDDYQKKSQAGFYNSQQAAQVLNLGIDKLQSNLKQLTTEYVNLASIGSKMTADQKKRWSEVNNEIKQTKDEISTLKQKQSDLGVETKKGTEIFKKLGGVMAATFSVGAILAFGKAIISSTGAGKSAVEGFQSGVNEMRTSLLRAISAGDFSGIITGLKNAYAEGKLFSDILSEIALRQAALGVFRETIETQIAEQRIIMMNAKLSVDVKEAAINEIIRLEKLKRDETLSSAEAELNAYLRISAVQVDASKTDKETIEERIRLIGKITEAYETASGTNKLNEQLADAIILDTELKNLITETQIISGDQVTVNKDYTDYNRAVKNLTVSQRELLDLLKVKQAIDDDEFKKIIQLKETRQSAYTEQLQGESAVQRRRNELNREAAADEKDKEKIRKKAAELEEARMKARLQLERELNNAKLESDKQLEKFIKDLESLDDLKIDLPDLVPSTEFKKSMDNYEIIMGLAKQTTAGQIEELNKQMEALKEWGRTGVITAEEYEQALKKLQDQLKNLTTFGEDHPLAAMLGIENEEQLNQIKDYVSELGNFVNEIVSQQVEATERIVDDQNQRIDEQQELVNREFELKKEGLANNFAIEDENLKKMQKARDEAIKEREKAIKLQRTLSTIESSISLVTASANIIKGFSGIPVVGVILGLAAVAAMIAGFISATSKVKDATQMEHGGEAKHGLLKGKRHTQGGIPINAEAGEWFINRQSSMKYSPLLDAINRDDERGVKLFFDRKYLTKLPGQSSFDIDKSKKLGEIVRQMKKGKADITYGNGFIIEKIGGYTKKINLN